MFFKNKLDQIILITWYFFSYTYSKKNFGGFLFFSVKNANKNEASCNLCKIKILVMCNNLSTKKIYQMIAALSL